MLGCLSVPHIVRRVGHIRTFAVMAAIAASAVQLMALLVEPLAWILLRAISGVAFAGLYMVIESWLNERASNTNRGQLFATYMVIQLGAITAGQMLLPAGDAAGFGLFVVASVAITLALVPVGLTSSSAPQPLGTVHLRLGRLYRRSPVGVLGCFFVGLANGAFGGLGVVFAQGVGLGTTGVALFMSAALVGGTLFQVPFGRLSDRIDRRKVLMLACLIAVLAGGVLALAGEVRSGSMLPAWLARIAATPAVLIGAVMVFGGCIYSMYSLCVAHTNDFVERADFVEASSGLLLTWGIGATLGPVARRAADAVARPRGPVPLRRGGPPVCSSCSPGTGSGSGRRCRPRRAPTSSRPATPGPRTCWRPWTRAPRQPRASRAGSDPTQPRPGRRRALRRLPRSPSRRSRVRAQLADASSAPREAMK